jgi:hypothetical protein
LFKPTREGFNHCQTCFMTNQQSEERARSM